jgi:hypothetical protein
MFGSVSSMLKVTGVVAAGAAVVAAAGCSSGSSSSSSAPASVSASSPAAASSAPSSVAASSGAASPNTVTGASPTASGGGSGAAACTTQDLKAALVNSEGAAGSLYVNLDFTNTGSAACTLFGFPGVSIGSGTPFKQVGAAATRSTSASPTLVTLTPGQTGNAQLRIVQAGNFPSATCSPAATTSLQVFPPNQTTPLYLSLNSTGCTSKSVNILTIGVVQAGTGA